MPNTVMNDVEIFEGGLQKDSRGIETDWTPEILQQIADNFNAQNPETVDAAPAVIGHPDEGTYPSETAPAYGWLHNVRLKGLKLIGDFRDCAEEFKQWVEEKRYSNRSISIDGDAMTIKHVGWLGAVLPAVKSLASVKFNVTTGGQMRVFSFADGNGAAPETSSQPAASATRTERATQYKITAIPGQGYDEKPARLADLPDDQFADPVNYRFPLTEEFIDTSVKTWGKQYVQDQYTDTDRKTIGARLIIGMVQHGFQVPSYWCYKELPAGSQFKFGNHFVEVPAEMLTRSQLLKVVASPSDPLATTPTTSQVPSTNSPTIKEFSQMTPEQQAVLDAIKKFTDFISTSQTPEVVTAIMAEADKMTTEIKTGFETTNAAGTTASEPTVPATTTPTFSENEKKMQAQIEILLADKRFNEHSKFAENAVNEGKILPFQKNLVIDLLEATRGAGAANFSEKTTTGVLTVKKDVAAAFKELIDGMKQFDFKAKATNDNAVEPPDDGESPLHSKVLKFQAEQNALGKSYTYYDAIRIVTAKGESN